MLGERASWTTLGCCALAELVEAAVRSDDEQAARDALKQLEIRTSAAGTDWALGDPRPVRGHSSAMTPPLRPTIGKRSSGSKAAGSPCIWHVLSLLHGEWLRRQNRRRDARAELRSAYDMFERSGAEGFAQRARGELSQPPGRRCGGPALRPRSPLTAQEAQIARLASDGLTNPEIAAQLFLSRHTIEWHLRKVFSKLGISSRRQLKPHARRSRDGECVESAGKVMEAFTGDPS